MPSDRRRLVIVSNRLPAIGDRKGQAGGLALALQDMLARMGGLWVGWSGHIGTVTGAASEIQSAGRIDYAAMELSRQDHAQYYNGFANRTLWPLFHYRIDLSRFDPGHFATYMRVNRLFAERVSELLRDDDEIWIHDYHLIPLAAELRRLGHAQPIGLFLHTPFPVREILTALPVHEPLMRAMAGYDLIGFQTEDHLRAFADYARLELGAQVMRNRRIEMNGRSVGLGVFPIGIDPAPFARGANEPVNIAWLARMRRRYGNSGWLIGVDRLDYSKGIVERLRAFERFLDTYPDYRGQVVLFQVAPPSRADVPEYQNIRNQLETEAGHINGRFADFDWVPINYINRSYRRDQLATFYRASRIGCVTPLRDGMNLVAKEYVASQDAADPGVLILSRFAGAAKELDGALIVNPYDYDGVAGAISRGLDMAVEERRERWRAMMAVIERNDLRNWCTTYLRALERARATV